MSKVLIIGIDGLDRMLLSKFKDYLPTFSKLKSERPQVDMVSVFPPDTMPAWVSIYTGLNPAKHGVINFLDSQDKDAKLIIDGVENTLFRGKAFWDIASRAGKKVCVVLPYAVYPAYPVNGAMVCRTLKVVPENFPVSTYPLNIFEDYALKNLNLNIFHGFPSRNGLGKFQKSCRKRTMNEADIGLKLLNSQEWDLFFIYMSALDAIQHTFWSHFDKNHPDYIKGNCYEDSIRDFYVLFDRIVGEFVNSVDQDTTIIIVSDHGQGMRPVRVVNVNEVLRRQGYLVPKKQVFNNVNPLTKTDFLKNGAINFVDRFGIGLSLLRLMHKFPAWKKFFTSPSFVDWENTVAYVSDLSAIKCYSYCGIIINKLGMDNEKYEQIRSQIINKFAKLTNPETGSKLVKWCCRREEVYSGKYSSKYPDILLEFIDDYGAGWSIDVPIVGLNSSRGLQPGTHKANSAVFIIGNLGSLPVIRDKANLMDAAPTILDLLGVPIYRRIDGNSLFKG